MMKNRGFTLIELVVSLAIASIVMAAFFLAYQAQVAAKISQEGVLDRTQEARASLQLMAGDIRMAGSNPTGTLPYNSANLGTIPSPVNLVGFLKANGTEFVVAMDFSGAGTAINQSDGTVDQPGEVIRYALIGSDLIRERVGTDPVGGVPLVRNVDALNFVYLDTNNGALSTPPADLGLIRGVEIAMVVRAGQGHRGLVQAYTDRTSYTNQRGTQILAPPNDTFRRIAFTTTVQCRNMGR